MPFKIPNWFCYKVTNHLLHLLLFTFSVYCHFMNLFPFKSTNWISTYNVKPFIKRVISAIFASTFQDQRTFNEILIKITEAQQKFYHYDYISSIFHSSTFCIFTELTKTSFFSAISSLTIKKDHQGSRSIALHSCR